MKQRTIIIETAQSEELKHTLDWIITKIGSLQQVLKIDAYTYVAIINPYEKGAKK